MTVDLRLLLCHTRRDVDDTLAKLPPAALAVAYQDYLVELARSVSADTGQDLVVLARTRAQDATADLVSLGEALAEATAGRKSRKTLAQWLGDGAPQERHRDLLEHLLESFDDGVDALEDAQRNGGLRGLRLAGGEPQSVPVFVSRLGALLESLQETLEEWEKSGPTEEVRERLEGLPESLQATASLRPPSLAEDENVLDAEDDLVTVDLEERERDSDGDADSAAVNPGTGEVDGRDLLEPSSLMRIAELLAEEDDEEADRLTKSGSTTPGAAKVPADKEDLDDLGLDDDDDDDDDDDGPLGEDMLLALAREVLGDGPAPAEEPPEPQEAPLVGKLRELIEQLAKEGGLELAESAKPGKLAERLADALDELSRQEDPAGAVLDWFLDQDDVEEVFFDSEDLGRRLAALG